MRLQPTLWRASMLHAHRRYAIAMGGFFLLSGLVLAEVLLRYQYQNAHRTMALRYQGHELCTMPAPDPRLIYTYRPNTCGMNARGCSDTDHAYEKSPAT